MPLNLTLALACILAPDVQLDAPPAPLSAFQSVALQMEWMDPRERRWLFADDRDFSCDLRRMQERAQDLADAPPSCDAARLPSRDLCISLREANREYRAWLEDRQRIDCSEWIAEAIAECDRLYFIWDTAVDVQTEYYYVQVRRHSLAVLREWAGPQLYYAGCLPCHVPVWRMRRAD